MYSSMGKREGLQNGSKNCYDVWFGHGSTDKKTEGIAGNVQFRWE